MNGVQTRFKCKLDVKRCKRFVFPPSSLLPRSNALKTKAIRYFQTDRTLTRIVSPPLNQVAYKVIGNDLCVAMSGEAAQMELNAMEPVMAQCCFESADLLMNGFDTLRTLCIDGITANEEKCRRDVHNSIGVVTALNPVIGYKNSTKIAKEALETGKGVYELVLEHNILSKKDLDTILEPENMIKPVKLDIHPNR